MRLDLIKHGYWQLADRRQIVAIGPELDLTTPHDRAHLDGKGIMERGA